MEYESIFDNLPSFQEKKAFIEVFRKKWREDKGFCSIFDKRQTFKQAILDKRRSIASAASRDAYGMQDGLSKGRPKSSAGHMSIGGHLINGLSTSMKEFK